MLSLRARLLLGLVALVVVGILVADFATYASLKTFLYQRVDKQLTASDEDVVHQLNSSYEPHGPGGPGPEGGPQQQNLPAGTYAAVLAPDGDADLPAGEVAAFEVVGCRSCGGTLKPDVVFFGGSVSDQTLARAWALFLLKMSMLNQRSALRWSLGSASVV